jgi:hypothetical protein
MIAKKLCASIAAAAVLFSGQLVAEPITNFSWNLQANWANWNNDGPTPYTNVTGFDESSAVVSAGSGDATTVEWGTGTAGPSGLVIQNPFVAGSFVLTETFAGSGIWTSGLEAGSLLTHINNPITSGGVTLSSLNLIDVFNLSSVAPAHDFDTTSSIFDILFKETTNLPGDVDDIFVVENPGELTQDYVFGGYTYSLNVTAVGLGPLAPELCGAVPVAAPCFGITTAENGTTDVQFFLELTARANTTDVPEPASLGILGLGLVGLSLAKRRKANA